MLPRDPVPSRLLPPKFSTSKKPDCTLDPRCSAIRHRPRTFTAAFRPANKSNYTGRWSGLADRRICMRPPAGLTGFYAAARKSKFQPLIAAIKAAGSPWPYSARGAVCRPKIVSSGSSAPPRASFLPVVFPGRPLDESAQPQFCGRDFMERGGRAKLYLITRETRFRDRTPAD